MECSNHSNIFSLILTCKNELYFLKFLCRTLSMDAPDAFRMMRLLIELSIGRQGAKEQKS